MNSLIKHGHNAKLIALATVSASAIALQVGCLPPGGTVTPELNAIQVFEPNPGTVSVTSIAVVGLSGLVCEGTGPVASSFPS